MAEGWEFLSKVHSMLTEANVIGPSISEQKIVHFKQPKELQEIIDTRINDEPCRDLEAICRNVLHYSIKTSHTNFHNQLFGGLDPYGLAGSWITEALNTSQYTYEMAPVFTLIENAVIEKTLQLFGYDQGDGIFSPGGSISNMYSMVLARLRALPNSKTDGLFSGPQLVAFCSEASHYSFSKSCNWLGLGQNNLIKVKCDSFDRMVADDLTDKIEMNLAAGKKPFYVAATCGTTVTGAFDDLNAISDVCKKYGIWFHIDACWGGSAALSPTHRHLISGCEKSDSLSWNPHKALGVPLQCSLVIVREAGLLHAANSASARYLFQQDKFYDVSYDTGDKSVQCGRKVDAFKFWLILKARGCSEIGSLLDNAMGCAQFLFQQIAKRTGFRLVFEQFQFMNICFWYIPKKMRNAEETDEWWQQLYKIAPMIKEKMMKTGSLMIGYSPLGHQNHGNFIRMVVTCHPRQTEHDMLFVIDEIERLGEECIL